MPTDSLPRLEGFDADELFKLAIENGGSDLEGYQQFLDIDSKEIITRSGLLPPSEINFVKQTRENYETDPLVNLSYSIEAKGQAQPSLIAWCTSEESAQAYLDGLNEYKGTDYSLEDSHIMPSTLQGYEGHYFVLIAGHRRTLAAIIKNIRKSTEAGDESPNPDFEPLEVKMYKDITFDDGIELQLTENIREEVPPHEEAIGIAIAYERQMAKYRMPQKAFAKTIGIGPDRLRRALRFRSLPKEVHSLVAGDHNVFDMAYDQKGAIEGWDNPRPLGYLAAVELAKLKGKDANHQLYTDEEIVDWGLIATRDKWSLDQSIEKVNELVAKRELPSELEEYIDASGMGTEYAEIISRLKEHYTVEKMLLLLHQCDAEEWDRFAFSKRVNTLKDQAVHGEFQLFSGTDMDAMTTVAAIDTKEAERTAKALGDIKRISSLLKEGYVDVSTLLRSEEVRAELISLANALETVGVEEDVAERLKGAAKMAADMAIGEANLVLDPITEHPQEPAPEESLF